MHGLIVRCTGFGMACVAIVCAGGQAGADTLAPYGQNQGETYTNQNFEGKFLIYDNISNGNINGSNFEYANLTGADLYQCSRYDTNFNYAILSGANLQGGYGYGATFVGANLTNADLSLNDNGAVNFSGANLSGANLDTYLDGAIFASATLIGADFNGSSLYTTNFENTDLSGANFATAKQLNQAIFGSTFYNAATIFPTGFSPASYGLILVPEPSTAALLGASVVALFGWAWRKRAR